MTQLTADSIIAIASGIRTHCGPIQARWLHGLSTQIPPNSAMLEIGAHKGYITTVLAGCCAGTERRVYSIDHMIGGHCDIVRGSHCWYIDYINNLVRRDMWRYVVPFPMDSLEALKTIGMMGVMFSLVYIDGDHSAERVTAELKAILPMVNPGGFITGDDLALRDNAYNPDVGLTFNEAWDMGLEDQFIYPHSRDPIEGFVQDVPRAVWNTFRNNPDYKPLPNVPGNQFGFQNVKPPLSDAP